MFEKDVKIGLFFATCIVAGNMIGSGIFLLPSALAQLGSASVLAWFIAGLGAAVLALMYARLALIRPANEGLMEYPRASLPEPIGFLNWFFYWFACWAGNGAIILAAVGYFKAIFGLEITRLGDTALFVGGVWLAAGANLLGPAFIGRISAATLAVGLAPILATIIGGALYFDAGLFAASWNQSGAPLLAGLSPLVLTVFWAFIGLESANVLCGVVRNPARTIPYAALLGTGLAGVAYLLASISVFGLVTATDLQNSSAPFADAVAAAFGPVAGIAIAACAFLRTFGCASGWLLVSAEVNDAAVGFGYLPRQLRPTRPEGRRWRGVVMIAALMSLVGIATMSPTLNEQFIFIVDIAVLMFLFVYGTSGFALMRLSQKGGDRALGALGVCISSAVMVGYFFA